MGRFGAGVSVASISELSRRQEERRNAGWELMLDTRIVEQPQFMLRKDV